MKKVMSRWSHFLGKKKVGELLIIIVIVTIIVVDS